MKKFYDKVKALLYQLFFNTACDIQNILYTHFGAETNKYIFFLGIDKIIYSAFETLPDALSFLHRLI
jgi:hypothetical protein